MDTVEIYCHGTCVDVYGLGGYGCVIRFDGGKELELSGLDEKTTVRKMQLIAAIKALETLTKPSDVKIYTDSEYLVIGATKWIHEWQKNGWVKSDKKRVKNQDLWKCIVKLSANHKIEWILEKYPNGRCVDLAINGQWPCMK